MTSNFMNFKTYFMKKEKNELMFQDKKIVDKIYLVKGQKVMLDRDLADLYGIETKVLKQAVRRNKTRFPPDFMFQMSKKDFENWRTQFASSKEDKQGLRYAPFCFTEQGVTMLSCILNSPRAMAVKKPIPMTTTSRSSFNT